MRWQRKAAQKQKSFAPIRNERLQSFKQLCSQTLRNSQGVDWQEAELALQNIVDYYAGSVRSELMLRRGVERLQDLKQKISFRADEPA